MTFVLGSGELTKSIGFERQITKYDFGVPFHLLLFFFIDPHGSDRAWKSMYLGVTQTEKCSPLARVETKMHFSIFANFQISRKWTKHSHFLAKMLAKFT